MAVYKLIPECKDYIWGGTKLKRKYGKITDKSPCAESWELSFHKDGLTKIQDGRVLAEVIKDAEKGINCKDFPFFPVLIKFIDAKENLSVQVHPSDDYALKNENSFGKTEMWYIVEAEQGAGIYCGFKEDTDKETFKKKIADGTVEDLLNFIPVKAGESYFIEAGTVHAIGKGCLICEIQQNSNLTYRVYDYNRVGADGKLRELHIDKALKVINFKKYVPTTFDAGDKKGERTVAACKYFRVKEIKLNGGKEFINKNSFTCFSVVAGKGEINGEKFRAGDSFFATAGQRVAISGKATVLITDLYKKKYYAGIDIGGTFVKCGIVSDDGEIIVKDKIPTEKEKPYQYIANNIAKLVKRLEKDSRVEVCGVGIGCPGSVDSENGVVVYTNNIAWKNIPLKAELEKLLGVPVKITNDANAAALGEYSLIKDKYKSMIFITLGTGVGSGIVIDGKLFEGYKSAGAEIGHQVIKINGEKCTCGRKGCFEAYCSTTALIRQAQKAMQKDTQSLLWKECGNKTENLNGISFFAAYDKQDKTAQSVFNRYIKYLAEGLTNVANIFRPEIILIGGGVSAQGDKILKPLKRKFNALLYGGAKYAKVELDIAKLQNDAGLIGAAYLNE